MGPRGASRRSRSSSRKPTAPSDTCGHSYRHFKNSTKLYYRTHNNHQTMMARLPRLMKLRRAALKDRKLGPCNWRHLLSQKKRMVGSPQNRKRSPRSPNRSRRSRNRKRHRKSRLRKKPTMGRQTRRRPSLNKSMFF